MTNKYGYFLMLVLIGVLSVSPKSFAMQAHSSGQLGGIQVNFSPWFDLTILAAGLVVYFVHNTQLWQRSIPVQNPRVRIYQEFFDEIMRLRGIRARIHFFQEYFYYHRGRIFEVNRIHQILRFNREQFVEYMLRLDRTSLRTIQDLAGLPNDQTPGQRLDYRTTLTIHYWLIRPDEIPSMAAWDELVARIQHPVDRAMFERMHRHLRGEWLPEQEQELLRVFCESVLVLQVPDPWPVHRNPYNRYG